MKFGVDLERRIGIKLEIKFGANRYKTMNNIRYNIRYKIKDEIDDKVEIQIPYELTDTIQHKIRNSIKDEIWYRTINLIYEIIKDERKTKYT